MFPSADRRQSNRITLELDKYGRAIQEFQYAKPAQEDPEITPWIEPTSDWGPPTPPPKSPLESQLVSQQASASTTTFSSTSTANFFKLPSVQKGSLASIVSYRQNSASSSRRAPRPSESQVTLQAPDNKRRSADGDGESSRSTLFYSRSSAHPHSHAGEVRKQKSFRFLSKLKNSASKPHLRPDSSDEHPENSSYLSLHAPAAQRRDLKGKKKSKVPPSPPQKGDELTLDWLGGEDINALGMDGIVDYNTRAADAHESSMSINRSTSESQSYSDHSLYSLPLPEFHDLPDFSNPFNPITSPQDKRKGGIIARVSPKSGLAPLPPTSEREEGTGSNSPTWAPPESWAVEDEPPVPADGAAPAANTEITDIEIESEPEAGPSSLVKTPASSMRMMEERFRKKSRNPGGESFSSVVTSRQGPMYRMRIYRPNSAYHVIAIDVDTTVSNLTVKLNRKLEANARFHNMYLKEQGRERILGPLERPAGIVKLRMQQAGYDEEDGMHLLGPESLGILVRFYYKSQLLAGEDQSDFQNFTSIDLSGKGLRTIPPLVHKVAEEILTLRLSRNPMIEIPLDFIQSCTNLRDLQLTHMSMKKLPQSLRHSETLRRLDISSNSIGDLSEALLDKIPGLVAIFASNNCLETMPWWLGRMNSLTTLNISNNKFTAFPPELLALKNIHDLDISFNMITELPERIGSMKSLEKLVIVGNQISRFPDEVSMLVNLGYLDCRRNQISNLSPVCVLAKLRHLSADHNMVHNLNLSLGPHLATLIASHNDVTQMTLVQGPNNNLPFALSVLDLSYARMSVLDDSVLSQLSALRTLRLDHNTLRSIPDSIGDLKWLETLSCTFNKLDTLPSTIGKLQKLETLEAHSNNVSVLPQSIWNCASLVKINLSSNCIAAWSEPPAPPVPDITVSDGNGNLILPIVPPRKSSLASIGPPRHTPPLVYSLEQLLLGENLLSDGGIAPLNLFKELRVLNLSYNDIQDLPPHFFKKMKHLQELHLSGNKLTNLPVEDFDILKNLSVIYLNGNKLQTLPQELGTLPNLTVLDVGSNVLKYNVNNFEFDWNWNFNPSLKYLNFSGNKRLQIKGENQPNQRAPRPLTQMSGFTKLNQLKVLGLMDVTVTMSGHGVVDIPDENADRRVRTSQSVVCGMSYGMADSMGSKDNYQYMLDLVHEFPSDKVAMFAMFGSTRPPVGLRHGSSPNRISKYLHDNFVSVFKSQLAAVGDRGSASASITKALHWTYLKLNQDLYELLLNGLRKNSQSSLAPNTPSETQYSRTGVSAVSVYFADRTLYAANVGDALAVVSRRGVHQSLSRKHDPYDPEETARIRAAEGSISPSGLVSDEVDVSRAFGFYHLFPPIIARPNIQQYELTEGDEFVIIANRGLWDYMSPKTAVDVARTVTRTTGDPMMAAAKLRDFAMSYGADGSTMVMVIWVADLFHNGARSRQGTLEIIDARPLKKKEDLRDRTLIRLEDEIPAPTGNVTLVFTDIKNSTHLWEVNPGMASAMRLHNDLLRRQLRRCGGYEVKTEGDSFMCSFPTPLAAAWWCLEVQKLLLDEPWPLEILESDDGRSVYDDDGRLVARGLSVRMGIHSGMPLCEPDLITHRMDYFGVMVSRAARIMSNALGGQIMCSMEIIHDIRVQVLELEQETDPTRIFNPLAVEHIQRIGVEMVEIGDVKLKGIELAETLVAIYPRGLEGRFGLKDEPALPVRETSSVDLTASKALEIGMIVLRMEAIATGRFFRPLPDRKTSTQLNGASEESPADPRNFTADPKLLLPAISEMMTEAELLVVAEGLIGRLNNALLAIYEFYNLPTQQPRAAIDSPAPAECPSVGSSPASGILAALLRDGVIDQATISKYSAASST